jgi:hypothetical protein
MSAAREKTMGTTGRDLTLDTTSLTTRHLLRVMTRRLLLALSSLTSLLLAASAGSHWH